MRNVIYTDKNYIMLYKCSKLNSYFYYNEMRYNSNGTPRGYSLEYEKRLHNYRSYKKSLLKMYNNRLYDLDFSNTSNLSIKNMDEDFHNSLLEYSNDNVPYYTIELNKYVIILSKYLNIISAMIAKALL